MPTAAGLSANRIACVYRRARLTWRRAIELQPTHVQALGSFGVTLCIRQRLDEGMRYLGNAPDCITAAIGSGGMGEVYRAAQAAVRSRSERR